MATVLGPGRLRGSSGFVDFKITRCWDVFSGAPQSFSAAKYGTESIDYRAYTPA